MDKLKLKKFILDKNNGTKSVIELYFIVFIDIFDS